MFYLLYNWRSSCSVRAVKPTHFERNPGSDRLFNCGRAEIFVSGGGMFSARLPQVFYGSQTR
jgi:hypothetical protein